MTSELETLKKQIADLHELVKKQSLIITKTGQNVLQLQLEKQRADVNKLGPTQPKVPIDFDSTDFASDQDLVDLVAELQGELNIVDERAIRRTANSTKTKATDIIAPLPNADGETPTVKDSFFPITLKDFISISDVNLVRVAKFYERLPPTVEEQQRIDNYLEGKVQDLSISQPSDESILKELQDYSKDEVDDMFNDVARYLGLTSRRGTETW
ncbi:hypothetical protein KAFR_0H03540 [Kazachstania africana CBS 2517]|uniref:Mrp8p n=1 Tax=Kazachstania africana (strain ATCC 22294 / BCRC 22015 / CBS 2517 / CECT 1963 / NBRC 1671 / NRRL Y-8276) TaxID=1071382 RepID=H2AYI7_KAZAF|nr:hypothetical protein KAFR_0H03540 [Kazachstania africana CBS 2517]CCF59764.1 hypothetical protein KAFR_0H03540 [Kazachstania africana CBS 2517]